MRSIEWLFDFVCGSTNVWALGGEVLPFCQRCTGLYVGASVATAAYLVFRPRATRVSLWIHAALLVGMIPFGYHWVEQSAVSRTVTGFLFACGIVYSLSLMPLSRSDLRDSWAPVALVLAVALGGLLVAVSNGGAIIAGFVGWVGLLGLLCFAVLLISSATCLLRP